MNYPAGSRGHRRSFRDRASLENRVAVVIGGGSGIGAASARTLAQLEATVIVADLNRESADAVAESIRGRAGQAWGTAVDAGDHDSVGALFDVIRERHGRVDIVHNNAAALGPEVIGRDKQLHDLEPEVVMQTLRVNVEGVIWGTKFAVPMMMDQGGGTIVNTSSVLAGLGDLQRGAYGASKAGVDALTRHVATQYGRFGIRCNAVAPGFAATRPGVESSGYGRLLSQSSALNQPADPQDIADAVAFLATDLSHHITGQIIAVDGGHSILAPWVAQQMLRRETEDAKAGTS